MSKKMNRRQFMGRALGSMAYLAAMSSPLSLLRKARASTNTQRYLINIQAMGGWDSHWFHHTFPSSHAAFSKNGTDYNTVLDPITGNPTNVAENYFHKRFPDGTSTDPAGTTNQMMVHPNRSDVYLGKGMNYLFSDAVGTDLLKNDIAIWRGIQISAAHGVGNQIIQGGSVSSYALSFSALIAQGIASSDYQRLLHYVQLSSTPSAFNSNFAMNTGAAVPVNLADFPSFQALTSQNVNDFSATSQLDLVNSGVAQLSQISSNRLAMSTSQQVYSSFMNGFNSATQLAGTKLATSNRFYYLWKVYTEAMFTSVLGMYNSAPGTVGDFVSQNIVLPMMGTNGAACAELNINSLSAKNDINNIVNNATYWTESGLFANYAAAKAADTANTPITANASINAFAKLITNGAAGGYAGTIVGTAFNYAMAEVMVREDLAAVIDIPTPTSDAHDDSHSHIVWLMMTYTAYKTLLSNLKHGDTSNNLLAKTTVAMWTELDRTPNWIINLDAYNRGTGHNSTTSVLLAGYGVNGGTVVGDVMTGPGGDYDSSWSFDTNNLTWNNNYAGGVPYSSSMPIDFNTGRVVPTGTIPNEQCVLPTMLAIFGFAVPPQQITDGNAVPALIKSG
jgi:hypothetical protein